MLALRFTAARQSRAILLSPSISTLLFSTTAFTRRRPRRLPRPSILTSFLPKPTGTDPSPPPIPLGLNFREWFLSRKVPLLDQIYHVLRTHDDDFSINSSLAKFNLYLTEEFVVEVLNYHDSNTDVLASLKFFDWAGRQKGFHHTSSTFHAIFRILYKADMSKLMHQFLENYENSFKDSTIAGYHSVLVVGYAVSGKCDRALQVFGKMRFAGVDLDGVAYHVFLDSLVDQGYFDVAETIVKEIREKGYENEVTHSIVVKSLSLQKKLDEGEEYLSGIVLSGDDHVAKNCGPALATLVSALCRDNQFRKAALLVEKFRGMGMVPMDHAYSAWIKELLYLGKVDGALKFLKDRKELEGYVPDVFRYNMLVSMLLREDRFEEVLDLLVEMKGMGILPDQVMLNSVLCLLCKVGRMDVAMDLYSSREEFGLSVNYMSYNYLINTLLGDVGVDQACRVLLNSLEQGCFPGQKTFLIIAHTLCREGKPDTMRELVRFTLERSIMPSASTYDKLISTLCATSRVDDAYWVYSLLNKLDKSTRDYTTYKSLIYGFSKSGNVQNACQLLLEMQGKGFALSRRVIREVICCICRMDNPEKMFFRLLEMQLVIPGNSTFEIYRCFIDGAGHARKPELARQVHEMMEASGVKVDREHDLVLLRSYVNGDNIALALQLFHDMAESWMGSRHWHIMIVGLSRISKPDLAASIMGTMNSAGKMPSIICYEEIIRSYCGLEQFHKAIDIVNDMAQIPRPSSSFIGNTFLFHSLRSPKLYLDWVAYSSNTENLTDTCRNMGHLIGVFSGFIEETYDNDNIEKLIQQCFPMDVFTSNMILRRAGLLGVDYACEYFGTMSEKGYEPNLWTYNYMVHALAMAGRMREARKLVQEMLANGYRLLEVNQKLL